MADRVAAVLVAPMVGRVVVLVVLVVGRVTEQAALLALAVGR